MHSSIVAVIDDQYKDNPPKQWASLNGDIILFYEGTSEGVPVKNAPNEEVLTCLKKVIQDRVYIRPPKEDRWVDVEESPGKPVLHAETGKPLRIKQFRMIGGNGANDQKVIFNPTGSPTVLKML